jgi:hypothetical protein
VIEKQKWDEVAEKFSHVTDKIGMPIDKGILETVVALNALDIRTSMSCEGHLDHGLPYPWVDVELTESPRNQSDPPEIAIIRVNIRELQMQIFKSTTPEMKQKQQEEQRVQLEERFKLFKVLSEFYQGRAVSFDRIITIEHGRIRSQGGDYLPLLIEDERAKKMNEYRDEMRDFTDFLKTIYFDSSNLPIGD